MKPSDSEAAEIVAALHMKAKPMKDAALAIESAGLDVRLARAAYHRPGIDPIAVARSVRICEEALRQAVARGKSLLTGYPIQRKLDGKPQTGKDVFRFGQPA
jgi:hypothetical protein